MRVYPLVYPTPSRAGTKLMLKVDTVVFEIRSHVGEPVQLEFALSR
jgi:hypothetical protein